MPTLKVPERIELAIIFVISVAAWLLGHQLPRNIEMGRLVLTASAILLAQSLVRDLSLMWRMKRTVREGPKRAARCMCVESTAGIAGIAAGTLLLGSGIAGAATMVPWAWSLTIFLALLLGFLSKDYVVAWGPLRLWRDPDHMNILFEWKTAGDSP